MGLVRLSMAAALLMGGVLVVGVGLLGAAPAVAAPSTWYAYSSGTSTSKTSCPQTTTTSSQCSLTQALSNVAAGDSIALATSGVEGNTSTYYVGNFTLSTPGTSATLPVAISPASGVTNPILDGNGGNASGCPTTICDGPVLTIGSGVYATIEGVTVQDASNTVTGGGGGMLLGNDAGVTVTNSIFSGDSARDGGGGIDSGDDDTGTLTVTNSTFSGDSSGDGIPGIGDGGGIDNADHGGHGILTVTNSTFSDDSTGFDGGGIDNANFGGTGTLTVTDSTFSNDSGPADGGGIDNGDDGGFGTLTVVNSTFSGDTASNVEWDGGGIDNGDNGGTGALTVVNSTFSGDSAGHVGGAISNGAHSGTGTAKIAASILAASPSGDDCFGSITDEGYNLDDDTSCGLSTADHSLPDESDTSIGLGPLQDDGGPTETIAISPSSVAASLVAAGCPVTDQRGYPRPSTNCSAGAYQVEGEPTGIGPVSISRLYGADAIGTSMAVSQAEFPTANSATAVVLARSDFFSDALAGGPLAAKVGGPLLITPGAPLTSSLDPRVLTEIQRVLIPGGTVYILGGDQALSPDIDSTLQSLGYVTKRIAGSDEYATAVDIAEQLGNPYTVFEATGLSFQDALSAVPAAIKTGGAILLTDGATQAPETAAYLGSHAVSTRFAVGGPLAAYGADPSAVPVYGQDAYGTSAAVASMFFPEPTSVGAATSAGFQDADSGGVLLGMADAPMLLVPPSGPLPASIQSYLSSTAGGIRSGTLFGGPLAVGDDVLAELDAII
jgi:hypothetical protein